ncbi:probable LRR receptor-like serine/threonine-protein kinase isoform X1 [Tanacetum coccineum]
MNISVWQNLTAVLPISLAKLPNIKHIDLSYNYPNGTIPREWASTKLEFLAVTGNRLSGSIPNFLGSISTLGYFPAELGKLKKLATLVLNATNNLTGELPEELNGLTSLIELRLSSNNFRGKIPNINITNIQKFEIQGSGLEGPIPVTIFRLRHLIELRISDLSGNTSQIPDLFNMGNMTKLMLRSCNITGTIPAYISEMYNLRHLDLSFNNLEGRIPDDLDRLNLQKL